MLFLTNRTLLATTRLWLETLARAILIAFLCTITSRLGLVVLVVTTISCLFCSSSFLYLTVDLAVVEVVVAIALALAVGFAGVVTGVAVALA